jgi:hypothetical protein
MADKPRELSPFQFLNSESPLELFEGKNFAVSIESEELPEHGSIEIPLDQVTLTDNTIRVEAPHPAELPFPPSVAEKAEDAPAPKPSTEKTSAQTSDKPAETGKPGTIIQPGCNGPAQETSVPTVDSKSQKILFDDLTSQKAEKPSPDIL